VNGNKRTSPNPVLLGILIFLGILAVIYFVLRFQDAARTDAEPFAGASLAQWLITFAMLGGGIVLVLIIAHVRSRQIMKANSAVMLRVIRLVRQWPPSEKSMEYKEREMLAAFEKVAK
jgi:hypothetical protein